MKQKPVVKFCCVAEAANLKQIRERTRRGLDSLKCPEEIAGKIVLALNEACMNIIQHAYGGKKCGELILELFKEDQNIVIQITDFAQPVNETQFKSRKLEDIRPGGLGMHIIRQVMDEIRYQSLPDARGNILLMKKTISTNQTSPGIQ